MVLGQGVGKMIELKINNLNFGYGRKKIFNDFNLTVSDGITLLLGANGSGKSTLFKLICGVLLPKNGSIEVFLDGEKIKDNKSAIAYIPQNFDAFPSLKVYDILTYICGERDKKLTKIEIKQQVEYAIEMADISEYANKKMRTLSGGTKQRVGIAQSILGNPKIIIADEPTAGLDPEQRERYNRIVAKTAKDRCFMISTHLFDDTQYYENMALIANGKMRFQGKKDEMINSMEDMIYQLSCSTSDFDEKSLIQNFVLLSVLEKDGKAYARFFSKNQPDIQYGELNKVDASLRDAWQYYCLEKND